MVKVQLIKNGRIVEVSNNEAHGLIESGEARLVKSIPKTLPYKTEQLTSDTTPRAEDSNVKGRKRGAYTTR